MRKLVFFIISVLISVSCNKLSEEPESQDSLIFTGIVGNSGGRAVQSSTYSDDSANILWEENDRITIYSGNDLALTYEIKTGAGSKEASFTKISESSGESKWTFNKNIGIYPNDENFKLSSASNKTSLFSMVIPGVQYYRKNTFGTGANPMVGSSTSLEDRTICFKNIFGFLVINLTGSDVVQSITLTGNNSEYLSGDHIVSYDYNDGPVCTHSDYAKQSVTLDCGENGVALSSTPTAFWIAIPPMTFSKGFSVEIADADGFVMKQSTDKEQVINRSHVLPMKSFEFVPDKNSVVLKDKKLQEYCVELFDADGDGKIQKSEAEEATVLKLTGKKGLSIISGLNVFPNLQKIQCNNCNTITQIDLTGLSKLTYLDFGDCQVSSIDLSPCPNLNTLYFARNKISEIDLSYVPGLESLYCDKNNISILDISPCPYLKSLISSDNPLKTVYICSEQTGKFKFDSSVTVIDKGPGIDPATIIEFEDERFKSFCVGKYDTNKDGNISYSEAEAVTAMDFPLGYASLTSLRELKYFTSLESFSLMCTKDAGKTCNFTNVDFSKCKKIKSIYLKDAFLEYVNISGCTKLEKLTFSGFDVEDLDVSFCPSLWSLYLTNTNTKRVNIGSINSLQTVVIWGTNLQELNLSNCDKLVTINVMDNESLKNLDFSKCTELDYLDASNTGLESIDLSSCTKITYLNVCYNNLSSLNVSKNINLDAITCIDNNLTNLDVSNLSKLTQLVVSKNKITSLDVSKNKDLNNLSCANNPLETLYVSEVQSLEGITYNRSTSRIPYSTNIIVVPAGDDDFYASTQSISLGCTASTFSFKVICPTTYTITCPSWITEDNTKANTEHTFSVGVNSSYLKRTGNIDIAASDGRNIQIPVSQDYGSLDYSRDGEVTVLQKASVGKGIDVVFVGDAFCDKDLTLYESYRDRALEAFFSEEPFSTFRDRFNVYSITAVSSHNVVGDGTKFSTVFTGGTGISGNHNAIFSFVSDNIKGLDLKKTTIVCLINSSKYAGTCWNWSNNQAISYVPLCTQNNSFESTFRHETNGHCFAKMADEYVNYNSTIPQSEIDSYNSWKDLCYGFWDNVDITDNQSQIKWSAFLIDNNYDGLVGIYEGAKLYGKGAYRATENSIMRYNTGGFNAPSRESMYIRIFRYSEGDSWVYDRDDFLKYDKKNITTTKSPEHFTPPAGFIPLASPVCVNGLP